MSAADDLAQEAWAAELAGRRPPGVPFARWAAAVVRNGARSLFREDDRRGAREREHARSRGRESAPGDAALERIEACERLVAGVRALDEPYRSAVVMRWFEGRSPGEIARATGAPVRTVHTRLSRALALLRARLDADVGGDRSAWVALVLPLALRPRLETGLLLMSTKTAIGLCAAAAVAVAAALHFLGDRADVPPERADAAELGGGGLTAPLEAPAVPDTASLDAPAGETRELAEPEPSEPSSEPALPPLAPAPATVDMRGRVVSADGHPVPGVEVVAYDLGRSRRLELGGPPIRTDADGRFAIQWVDGRPGELLVDDPRFAPVLHPIVWGDVFEPLYVVVVAPAIELAGTVADERGNGIAGARVAWSAPGGIRASLGVPLERNVFDEHVATCDALGRFVLSRCPGMDGARLDASHAGYSSAHVEAPRFDDPTLSFTLVANRVGELLRGRVVDRDGEPVAGASVGLGNAGARTDEGGAFALDLGTVGSPHDGVLRAAAPGRLPARLPCGAESPTAPGAWPDPLVLVLGGEALSIAGRVVYADGEPVASPNVELLDQELMGAFPFDFGDSSFRVHKTVESVVGEGPQVPDIEVPWHEADGAFRIDGLQERAYRLRVSDPATLQSFVTAPIAAGSEDVLLELPDEPRWPRLYGKVVDPRGDPVVGADIQVERVDLETGEARNGTWSHSDAEGAFDVGVLSRSVGTLLAKAGGAAVWKRFSIAELAGDGPVTIVVPLRCRVQVDLTASAIDADRLEFVDVNGERVHMVVTRGTVAWGATEAELVDRRSEVMSVTEDAHSLVLRAGGEEVARVPVTLTPGELTVLRP